MAHTCTTLVLSCIDWRLQDGELHKVLLDADLAESGYDHVALAGAVKSLNQPEHPYEREFVLKQIALSRDLHQITRVVLVNHQDCGAYGGSQAFSNDEVAELSAHQAELIQAAGTISAAFPELQVHGYLANLRSVEGRWAVSLKRLH